MSHFAKVENGIVIQVIVAEQDYIDTLEGKWIQTSYNTRGGIHYDPITQQPSEDQSKALRKNYAGLEYIYDEVRDAFYIPSPFPSWSLDEETCLWKAPVERPNDGNKYRWDEETKNWIK